MIAPVKSSPYIGYRIKLLIAVEKNYQFNTKNELLVPTFYRRLKDARADIILDIKHRLKDSFYFRSQKYGYDLVKYSREARVNTYMAYRIIPVKKDSPLATETPRI